MKLKLLKNAIWCRNFKTLAGREIVAIDTPGGKRNLKMKINGKYLKTTKIIADNLPFFSLHNKHGLRYGG